MNNLQNSYTANTGLRFFTVYGPCLSREMRSKFQREGRPDMAYFLFTQAILNNQPIKVFNNGNLVRDFTYIDDIIEGVIRVIDNQPAEAQNYIAARISPPSQGEPVPGNREVAPANAGDGVVATDAASSSQHNATSTKPSALSSAPYAIYNIGNSSPVQLMEYIVAIEKALGKEAQKELLPMQPGDVPRTEADVTDLMGDMNYKPDTPVQAGIEKFIEWYRLYFNGR
jgi:UDP-glucuronate 4-epimerase